MSDQFPIHNLEGKRVGSLPVPETLTGPVNAELLWQAVRMYRANQRQGNASTKNRGEVQGGGKKPFRQKHTGRARAGSTRSPIWVGGGTVFGPRPRSFRYLLPQKIRRSALIHSLKDKVASGSLTILESLNEIAPKTKALKELLSKIQGEGRTLVVVEQSSQTLNRISKNMRQVQVRPAKDLNCYDVLANPNLVVTATAFKQLMGETS